MYRQNTPSHVPCNPSGFGSVSNGIAAATVLFTATFSIGLVQLAGLASTWVS